MTESTTHSRDDRHLQAATLAFAMLRFGAGAAHPDRSHTPSGMLHTGTECYLFTPSWRRIPITDAPAYLAGLPSPALLTSTTTRGVASLTLLDELRGERHDWGNKILTNQRAGLEHLAEQLSLGEDARVVLQFDTDEYWYPFAVLREWCDWFGVDVGWNMRPYVDDARAQARLMLFRSDGVHSWGDAWPLQRDSTEQAT